MENRMNEFYASLSRHFSSLCSVPVTVVDTAERSILFTASEENNFFCDRCPNRCRLLKTMLYGCNEARRWNGRSIFYCPIGLVFAAVSVPETDQAVLAGPVIMGDVQDTLFDLPDHIDPEEIRRLHHCSSNMLGHLSSILEMAVFGLRYRPEPISYDRNIIPGEETPLTEHAEQYTSFPVVSALESELSEAVQGGDKTKAQAVLNQLLRYVYSPHPDQFALIRSRAIHLVLLLSKMAASGDADPMESTIYHDTFIPALKSAPSLEELDVTMAEILHHFIDYSFDFNQIKHSDVIYRIMDFIKSNYARKLGLYEIASVVHLSPSHISNMFHKETGQTLSAYINHVRIEKSKPLLLDAGIPISDVAALCGFEEQSYFTKVFKKETGLSPRKFREQTASSER